VTRTKRIKKEAPSEPSNTPSSTQQNAIKPSRLPKSAAHTVSADVSSKTAGASRPSTPSKPTSEAADQTQSNLSSPQNWPIFNKNDDTVVKGLPYFQAKKTNIINFEEEPNAIWKHEFASSEMLAWKDKMKHVGAVNLFVIGRLNKASLMAARSDFGQDPVYRLVLTLERETVVALRSILDNGPLKDNDLVNFPVLGRSATLSAKLRSIQKLDDNTLDADDPFPFVFDGRDCGGRGSLLKKYPVDRLCDTDMLAVEMNLLSYDIQGRGDSPGRAGYSLSLRNVYVFPESVSDFGDSTYSSPKSLKRSGDSLVSPRKNKKAGQLAVFSDDED
jgi:hypothetical protein